MCNFEQTALGSCRKIAGIHWGFRGLSRATRQPGQMRLLSLVPRTYLPPAKG